MGAFIMNGRIYEMALILFLSRSKWPSYCPQASGSRARAIPMHYDSNHGYMNQAITYITTPANISAKRNGPHIVTGPRGAVHEPYICSKAQTTGLWLKPYNISMTQANISTQSPIHNKWDGGGAIYNGGDLQLVYTHKRGKGEGMQFKSILLC